MLMLILMSMPIMMPMMPMIPMMMMMMMTVLCSRIDLALCSRIDLALVTEARRTRYQHRGYKYFQMEIGDGDDGKHFPCDLWLLVKHNAEVHRRLE